MTPEDEREEWRVRLAENVGKLLNDGVPVEEAERRGRENTVFAFRNERRSQDDDVE